MAYLVRKGTKVIVRKPSGAVVAHDCKDGCLFQSYEKVAEHKTMQFGRNGFLVSVSAADATEVR